MVEDKYLKHRVLLIKNTFGNKDILRAVEIEKY